MMSPEDPFIATILATPDDTAARLVYADWLEERGDDRGQFIRLREEMETLPVTGDRYWELKDSCDALAGEIDSKWIDRLGYTPTYRPLFTTFPESRKERWRLIRLFIEYWHLPLTPACGALPSEIRATEERLGVELPAALREWYKLAGRRTELWSRQDHLVELENLQIDAEEDALVFRFENQGCEIWGIRSADLTLDDPPVYAFTEPCLQSASLTAFAAQTLLLESMWTGAILAINNGDLNLSEAEDQLLESLTQCEVNDTYWVLTPVHFFEGEDLFVVATRSDGYVYIAARTRGAYDKLDEDIRLTFPIAER